MDCFPSCEVALPRIGKAYVVSKLDSCKDPALLTLSITSDGKRSVSTFSAGNQQEYRTIGNDYWPLQLQVRFRNAEGGYHGDACIHTVRTGNTTCFMNGFFEQSVGCGYRSNSNNGFPVVLLCVILGTCLLMISIAIIAMIHRLYSSQRANGSRKNSFAPTKNTCPTYATLYDPEFHTKFHHDERLAVIDEVDEKDNDCISIASSGFGSGHLKSVSEDECTRHTELSSDTRPILPSQLAESRRQSQPLLFPNSPTMDTFKPRGSLPNTKNPSFSVQV